MGFNPDVNPLMAMQMGMHPLDLATGQQSRYLGGGYYHQYGPEAEQKMKKNPLNPDCPDSPLKARGNLPTSEELYNTKAGDAKGKKALDHPYFTHQRLIERTLGNKEYLGNPNMTDEERNIMLTNYKEKGLADWQHCGDPTMFGGLANQSQWGPWGGMSILRTS